MMVHMSEIRVEQKPGREDDWEEGAPGGRRGVWGKATSCHVPISSICVHHVLPPLSLRI